MVCTNKITEEKSVIESKDNNNKEKIDYISVSMTSIEEDDDTKESNKIIKTKKETYYSFLYKFSKKYNIPIEIIVALIYSENPNLNRKAININYDKTKDYGLFQINGYYYEKDFHWRYWKKCKYYPENKRANLFSIRDSAFIAMSILSGHKRVFDNLCNKYKIIKNSWYYSLVAYNGGYKLAHDTLIGKKWTKGHISLSYASTILRNAESIRNNKMSKKLKKFVDKLNTLTTDEII
jgi:hypothetical protein